MFSFADFDISRILKEYSYNLGDVSRLSDMKVESSAVDSYIFAAKLRKGDAAFIKRSDYSWRFAIVAERRGGEDGYIDFFVDNKGSNKRFMRRHWFTRICGVKHPGKKAFKIDPKMRSGDPPEHMRSSGRRCDARLFVGPQAEPQENAAEGMCVSGPRSKSFSPYDYSNENQTSRRGREVPMNKALSIHMDSRTRARSVSSSRTCSARPKSKEALNAIDDNRYPRKFQTESPRSTIILGNREQHTNKYPDYLFLHQYNISEKSETNRPSLYHRPSRKIATVHPTRKESDSPHVDTSTKRKSFRKNKQKRSLEENKEIQSLFEKVMTEGASTC